jgi:hypothetical protein
MRHNLEVKAGCVALKGLVSEVEKVVARSIGGRSQVCPNAGDFAEQEITQQIAILRIH